MLSPRTREWYEWILNEYLDYVYEEDLPWDVATTIEKLFVHLAKKGQSRYTIHAYYRTLRRFFNWMEKRGYPNNNPMDMVEAPRKSQLYPRGIKRHEVEKILRSINPITYLDYRDRAIIIFLWDTGIRASELCALRLFDVSVRKRDGLIEVGKGRKFRKLSFGKQTQRLLTEWLNVRSQTNCNFLFVNRYGNPMTRSGLYSMLKRRKEEIGIECLCNPHAFRHGFAIEFLENGGNINNLRILMGHASLRSTEKYLYATDGCACRDHKKASPGDRLNI